MTISDFIAIVAVLVGPLLAVQVQKWLEAGREARQRRLALFRALMTSRANRVSTAHVEALNMIDLEFSGSGLRDKAVRDAWRVYHDHLNTGDEDGGRWRRKSDDLFVELLHAMGQSLGYEFDKVLLKRGVYAPMAHENEALYLQTTRKLLQELLEGKRAITVRTLDEVTTGDEGVTTSSEGSRAAKKPARK